MVRQELSYAYHHYFIVGFSQIILLMIYIAMVLFRTAKCYRNLKAFDVTVNAFKDIGNTLSMGQKR